MAETLDYRLGRIADIRLPEGANFSADFSFTGINLTGYVATLSARRASNGGKVPFTWSKSGLTVGATAISFDITPSTTDDASKAFSTVTARGATDYALTIRQSGGGPIVMRLQGTVEWVDDVGDFDPGTAGSNQVSVIVGSGTSVSVAVTNAGHPAVTVADSSSIDLTLTGQQISADAIFGTSAGTVCQGNDARLSNSRTPTSHASSHVTGGSDKIRDANASQDGLMTSAQASKLDGIAAGANNYVLPTPTTTTMGGVKRNTGSAGQYVSGIDTDGALVYGTPAGGGGGSGDVTGPASSVDNRIAIFNGTTGKVIEDSGVVITPAAPAVSEVFTATFAAASASDYTDSNGYMVIYSTTETVGVWFYGTAENNSQPSASVDRWIQASVGFGSLIDNESVAYAVANALEADADFSTTVAGDVVTVTVTAPGAPLSSPPTSPIGISFNVVTTGAVATLPQIGASNGSLIENISAVHISAGGETPGSDVFLNGSGEWAYPVADNSITYAKIQNISATSRILGRKTAAAGDAEECTLSEILDFVGSAAQGDILYRGASSWTRLGAGTSGQFLRTNGAGANPSWNAASAETAVLTGNYTDSTGTLGNLTGMSFSLAANERVTAIFSGFWGTQTTNSGFRYDITGPASPTYVLYNVAHGITQTAFRSGDGATAFSTAFVEVTGNASLYLPVSIHLHVVNGANAGTVQLRMGGETNGVTFTLYQGFTLQLFRF